MEKTKEELKRQADIKRLVGYSKIFGLAKPFKITVKTDGSWDIVFLK